MRNVWVFVISLMMGMAADTASRIKGLSRLLIPPTPHR